MALRFRASIPQVRALRVQTAWVSRVPWGLLAWRTFHKIRSHFVYYAVTADEVFLTDAYVGLVATNFVAQYLSRLG